MDVNNIINEVINEDKHINNNIIIQIKNWSIWSDH